MVVYSARRGDHRGEAARERDLALLEPGTIWGHGSRAFFLDDYCQKSDRRYSLEFFARVGKNTGGHRMHSDRTSPRGVRRLVKDAACGCFSITASRRGGFRRPARGPRIRWRRTVFRAKVFADAATKGI